MRKRLVRPDQIDEALALQRSELEQRRSAPPLGEILAQRKLLTKDIVRMVLEEQQISRGQKKILRISLREASGVVIIGLAGRLDESTASILTRALERLMNRGIIRIALDASGLLLLNSYGASSLVAYIDESRARGGDLKFFQVRSEVRFTLDRLGLTKFIQLFDLEKDALAAFTLPIDEYLSRGALGEYVSSESSKTYHLSYCPQAERLADDDKLFFESKWHARRGAKSPCVKCRP